MNFEYSQRKLVHTENSWYLAVNQIRSHTSEHKYGYDNLLVILGRINHSFQPSLNILVLQVLVQLLSVFQWCSKCEGERWSCLVSWVHLQEGPLVIVEGLHHFSETDTRVVVRVPVKGGERSSREWRGKDKRRESGGEGRGKGKRVAHKWEQRV